MSRAAFGESNSGSGSASFFDASSPTITDLFKVSWLVGWLGLYTLTAAVFNIIWV